MKSSHERDVYWMERALALAARGASGASPNPMVGCVIVRNGRVIAEGYHAAFGGPHAEVSALSRLKDGRAPGATFYINLEPCSHWGKTGPCADAIARSGAREVVAAMGDPNPLVRGKGFAKLKKAGIRVRSGVLQERAKDLNRSFIKFITHKRPFVFLKAAMSLDGKTATRTLDSKWITSPAARELSQKMRGEMDAILVGAETVRRDNPELTTHGKGRDPIRCVVSASGRLPRNAKIFNGRARTWIFHANAALKSRKTGSAEWIYIKPHGKRLDFKTLSAELGSRGIARLLVEGGARTLGWALDSGKVDEGLFFVAPLLIGGSQAKPAIEGIGVAKLKDALRFSKLEVENVGSDLFIRARK